MQGAAGRRHVRFRAGWLTLLPTQSGLSSVRALDSCLRTRDDCGMSDDAPHAAGVDRASDALSMAIEVAVAGAMKTLSSTRVRGPHPNPCAADLAGPSYLRELARWSRAAANRSTRTLGPRRHQEALEAASRLALAAEL